MRQLPIHEWLALSKTAKRLLLLLDKNGGSMTKEMLYADHSQDWSKSGKGIKTIQQTGLIEREWLAGHSFRLMLNVNLPPFKDRVGPENVAGPETTNPLPADPLSQATVEVVRSTLSRALRHYHRVWEVLMMTTPSGPVKAEAQAELDRICIVADVFVIDLTESD